jgi:hypothetical protein
MVWEATELVGAATDDVLFNYSRRAYLWGHAAWSPPRLSLDPLIEGVGERVGL